MLCPSPVTRTSQGAPPLDIPAEPFGWLPASLAALCAARTAIRLGHARGSRFAERSGHATSTRFPFGAVKRSNGTTVDSGMKRIERYAGFTLVELLVVIAVIEVVIALLWPAVQQVRDDRAARAADSGLQQLSDAVQVFHSALGELPAGLDALVEYCDDSATPCSVDSQLASGLANGYRFFVVGLGANAVLLEAEPLSPATGSLTLIRRLTVITGGALHVEQATYVTPGADLGAQALLDKIRGAGIATIGKLLVLEPSLTGKNVRESTPLYASDVLQSLDRNGDGHVSAAEVRAFVAAQNITLEEPLASHLEAFLSIVESKFKMDAQDAVVWSEDAVLSTTAGLADSGLVDPGILCRLTRAYIVEQSVANHLCGLLRGTAVDDQRGNVRARDNLLEQYLAELRRQVHGTLTRHDATTLKWGVYLLPYIEQN
jgi:type II secretory pathway pseudopilin PulG